MCFLQNWHLDPCNIILLDLNLGDGNGGDLLPLIDELDPRPGVAILSGFLDNETILEMCRHCVVCLSKPIASRTLLATAGLLARKKESTDVIKAYAEHHRLSGRETEVLSTAVTDGGIERTADQLGVAPSTVISYWRRVFRKTGCGRQQEVLASVLRFALDRCRFHV